MSGLWVGGLLVAVYLVINPLLPIVPINVLVKTYLFQPLLWGLFILTTRWLPGFRTLAKQYLQKTFIGIGLSIAFLQIFLFMICGLFTGFGRNPASLTPLGITENLFFIGFMLIGMEISRAWLIGLLGKRHPFLALAAVTLFYTLLSIPLSQMIGFKIQMQSTNLVISSWVPLLAENLLASFLAMLAGARASLAYRGLLAAFWWFCPILPNLNFSLKGLIGTAVPVLGLIAVSSYYSSQVNRGKSRRLSRSTSFPAGWVVTALLSVIIVWFAVGLFPLQPSLVPSGSMIPTIRPGDVVIVAKSQAGSVTLGDIVEYHDVRENLNIVHRVIEVHGEDGQRYFITKGDNNSSPDADPVPAQNVIGKVVFNIPKVGWISILVKSLLTGGK